MRETERYLHVFLKVGILKVFTSRPAEPLVQVVFQGVEAGVPFKAEAHRSRESLICYRDQGKSDVPITGRLISAYSRGQARAQTLCIPGGKYYSYFLFHYTVHITMASSVGSSHEASPNGSASASTISTESSTMSTVQGVERPPDDTSKLRMFLGILRK